MNSKTKLLVITLVLGVLLAAGAIFYGILGDGNSNDVVPGTGKGSAADFLVLSTDGKAVHLSDFKGKPTVINFWATWCGYCKMEMPAFEALYKEYGDKVNFMMVDLTDGVQETEQMARDYIKSQNYTFPIYFDTTLQAKQAYQANSIPLTVFVDEKGILYQKHAGAMNEATLRNYIENLLGGK